MTDWVAQPPERPLTLETLSAQIIDYVESYPWNNQYTLAGRAAQVEAVKERLIQAYNLGAEKLAETLATAAAGCGDAGCVEHGFTGPSPVDREEGPCQGVGDWCHTHNQRARICFGIVAPNMSKVIRAAARVSCGCGCPSPCDCQSPGCDT